MNILIFDTETVSLAKPFCYNIGYVITNTETKVDYVKKSFIVEQVWHNPMLFSTSYYADKKQIYINALRGRKTLMKKWGHITQIIASDIKKYDIEYAYAYNSPFDTKVFNFNSEWFRTINPFDTVKILDIMSFIKPLVNEDYKEFCKKNNFLTDSGNYPRTAEVVYRYLKNDINFIEDHTALSDSIIEKEILLSCKALGEDITIEKKPVGNLKNDELKTLQIFKNKEHIISIDYNTMRFNKGKTKLNMTSK